MTKLFNDHISKSILYKDTFNPLYDLHQLLISYRCHSQMLHVIIVSLARVDPSHQVWRQCVRRSGVADLEMFVHIVSGTGVTWVIGTWYPVTGHVFSTVATTYVTGHLTSLCHDFTLLQV